MSERATKWVILITLAFVLAGVAAYMAHSDVTRIFWDRGHSDQGMRARFYYLVLMGLSIVIVQQVYIRKAQRRLEQQGSGDEEAP